MWQGAFQTLNLNSQRNLLKFTKQLNSTAMKFSAFTVYTLQFYDHNVYKRDLIDICDANITRRHIKHYWYIDENTLYQ